MIIFKLAFNALIQDKVRALSALLGIAAAVALLGWHLALTSSIQFQADSAVARATAPYEGWICGPSARPTPHSPTAPTTRPVGATNNVPADTSPKLEITAQPTQGFRRMSRPSVAIPEEVRSALSQESQKLSTTFVTTQVGSLDIRPGGRVLQGPPLVATVTEMPTNQQPLFHSHSLVEGRWPDPKASVYEVAFNIKIFEDRHVPTPTLGSSLPMLLPRGTVPFVVVGLFSADTLIKAFPSGYTTSEAMARMASLNPRGPRHVGPNLALCSAVPSGDLNTLLPKLLEPIVSAQTCSVTTRQAVVSQFRSDTAKNLFRQLPMSLSLAGITAAFMLFTLLSMSLNDHRKRIALLRCIGLTRGHALVMMLTESGILTLLGWLLGLLASLAGLQIFLWLEASPDLPQCIHLNLAWEAATLVFALVIATFASLAPARKMLKVAPLEATRSPIDDAASKVSISRLVWGITLLFPILLLACPFSLTPSVRSALMLTVGVPAYLAGSILCFPAVLRVTEKLATRPLAACLRLNPTLLSQCISRSPGRSIGTLMTISLGLGTFIAIHIWGGSLMSSYVPSAEWPDAIVSVLPNGLPKSVFQSIATQTPGLASPALALEASQFPLSQKTQDQMQQAGLPKMKSDCILVMGVDPIQAFQGPHPFAPFRFVEGSASQAAKALQNGSACIIPQMLSRLTGLHVGDTIEIGEEALTIAGVIDLNWHLVTSRAQVRTRSGRLSENTTPGRPNRPSSPPKPTAGMVWVSEAVARKMTDNPDRVYFFWVNLNAKLSALHPLQATQRLDDALCVSIEAANPSPEHPLLHGTNLLRVHHRDEIADGTLAHGNDILGTMARIPFWSLLITASGMAALLVNSVKSRHHEFKTLRAIGLTQGQFARLLLGELFLLILSTLFISLLGGILIGWSFTAVTRTQMAAGLPNSLIVPWHHVFHGILFAWATTCLMGILPIHHLSHH